MSTLTRAAAYTVRIAVRIAAAPVLAGAAAEPAGAASPRTPRSARAPPRHPCRGTSAAAAPPPRRAASPVVRSEPEQLRGPCEDHRLPAGIEPAQVTRVGHALQDGSGGDGHAIRLPRFNILCKEIRTVTAGQMPIFRRSGPRLDTNGSDASECLQDAEVQSRGRNTSCNCPFTQCEGRVPKAEGPEEDRDEVLYPAMERRRTASNMGGCCVVEDTNQNVDRDEKPILAEKDHYISCNSPIYGHLSSPPVWTLKVVRMSDRLAGTRRGTCGRRMSCSSPT